MGDGSPNNWRTKQTIFALRLEEAGFSTWNTLAKFWETRELLAGMLGEERVLVKFDERGHVRPEELNGSGREQCHLRSYSNRALGLSCFGVHQPSHVHSDRLTLQSTGNRRVDDCRLHET
jgi:hypothetical protein